MAFPSTPRLSSTVQSFFFLAIFRIGLFCTAHVHAGGDVQEMMTNGGNKQREFDYFKLTFLWPGTLCRGTQHCCSTNGCCHGSYGPAGFTIHGLWSDYNDGTFPSCCHGKKFNITEVATLLDDLNKYWPSLSCSPMSNCHGGEGVFLEHEWEKHGTCSSSVTGDEYNYFLTTLSMYFKYNVTEVLQEAGYAASSSEKYPVGGIILAIQNAFSTTPQLQCSGDALEELRLCFYKDFKPRDCAADFNLTVTNCPGYVSLPELVSFKLADSETEVSSSTLQSSI